MARELSFKTLPFVPINGQVIYVEQSYNEKLNKFIRNHYDWLRITFRSQGLEFCFLPLLAEEAIAYNAPYLTAEELDNQIKNIPSLSDFLADKNAEIEPSLVFALDIPVVNKEGNTVLQVIPIEPKWYTSTKSTFSSLVKEIKSISKEQSKKYHEIERNRKAEETARQKREKEALKRKKEEEQTKKQAEDRAKRGYDLFDDEIETPIVADDEPKPSPKIRFSLKAKKDDIRYRHSEEPDLSSTDGVKFSRKRKHEEQLSFDDSGTIRFRTRDTEKADNNFDFQSQLLIDEIKQRIEALRNRGVNTMFLHNLIDEGEHLSRLRITKDFRIFLVDYDNIEIKLPVLPKSVFILFLRHPEGIRFKELTDYYSELLQIYLKMNPNGGRSKQEQSIRDITDPCSNSINEKCARIREAFVSNFDDRLAKNYYVTGKRGESKRIMLDESMILWEK